MAEQMEQDVRKLFKRWRGGDAEAGQAMAQRFSDWYYAITAVRLGDTAGRAPLERACQAFAQGIVNVGRSGELVDWAHGLVAAELQTAGSRVKGGDFPNALTKDRSPSELLAQVRGSLTESQVRLLHMAYGHAADLESLMAEAEQQGGYPLALLEARYALKEALRGHAKVPFQVIPSTPNLDLVPLPLYEADRMEAAEDERDFEQWLISDLELCQDVAEFATFSHALRAGAFGGKAPVRTASSAPTQKVRARQAGAPLAEDEGTSAAAKAGIGIAAVVGVLVVGGVLLAIVAALVLFVF